MIDWLPSLGAVAFAGSALLAAAPPAARAIDLDGDLFLSTTNDDADARRWSGEVAWVEPLTDWLKGELGGSYARFDDARWGYGALGAHLSAPGGRNHLSLRYEHGAGHNDGGDYEHVVGKAGLTHALVPGRIFVEGGMHVIRVDDVDENLARVGLGLVPLDWLSLHGDYHHSVFGGEGTRAWSARSDLRFRRASVFGGYARSEDTVDLRSIGGSRDAGRPTHEVFAGVEVPVGRHAVTLAGSRYESRSETRWSMTLTLRWKLFWRPAARDEEPETPLRGSSGRAVARADGPGR